MGHTELIYYSPSNFFHLINLYDAIRIDITIDNIFIGLVTRNLQQTFHIELTSSNLENSKLTNNVLIYYASPTFVHPFKYNVASPVVQFIWATGGSLIIQGQKNYP